ncbi:MAG: ABC transporter permease [Deltaproteobacteria bacterium]|nr:ABC transporter permease [Deltaproteobacteria bacterium]
MKVFLLKRLGFAVFTMFFVVTIVFFLFRSGEADPAAIMLPPDATPRDMEILTKNFGLDKPLPIQYLNFLKNALRGDFGKSFRYNEPAAKVLFERFPASIQLGVTAFFFSAILGLSIGVLSAVRRDGWIDRFGRVLALGGMSIPAFWLGVMLMLLFSVNLGWLPVAGRGEGGLDTLRHMILPVMLWQELKVSRNHTLILSTRLKTRVSRLLPLWYPWLPLCFLEVLLLKPYFLGRALEGSSLNPHLPETTRWFKFLFY